MSILSDARQLLAETDQKIRDPTLTATETAWAAINFADKMSVMLPEVLAYAEMRERQAIHECALRHFDHDHPTLPFILGTVVSEDGSGYDSYMADAANELNAGLPPRITEEEKAAIRWAIELMGNCRAANVLRGLIQ